MQTGTEKQNAKHQDTWKYEETKGMGRKAVTCRGDTENVTKRDAEKHQEMQTETLIYREGNEETGARHS